MANTSKDLQFSISDLAKWRIAKLLSDFRLEYKKEAIPAIMWIDSTLNDGKIDSQPAIGLYDDRDEIALGDLLVVDGIKIAIAVADQDVTRFNGKILDYDVDRFILR